MNETNPEIAMGSFIRMLTDENYVQQHISEFTSPTPTLQIGTAFENPSLDYVNLEQVDGFGILEDHVDSDEEVDEAVDNENDIAIRTSAPSQSFNVVEEMDPMLCDSWMTWLGNNTYNGEFSVGQDFDSLRQIKDIMKSYSISKNQTFRVVESGPSKYVVECKRKKTHHCPWKLRAIKDPLLPIFRVVRYNGPHASNCVGDITSGDHQNLTFEYVCNIILDLVRADPSLKIRVTKQVLDQIHFTITYRRAWLANQKAIAIIFGDWEQSYEELPRYMKALQEVNEGTMVHWCTEETSNPSIHVFKRVFWAFKPFIDGFRHCRPLITIDGTHLYGKYKGTLLIAMATDANFQLFPLAFAIVDKESIDTWSWFMTCLKQSVTQREGLCVISDRHVGILDAMNKEGSGWEEPFAHHRYCIRHLASNVGKHFKTHIKDLFGCTTDERQKKKFDFWFKRIGELDNKAREYLDGIPLHLWSIHHDGGYRYGIGTTNMSECFNRVMKGARCLPIKAIVEMAFFSSEFILCS